MSLDKELENAESRSSIFDPNAECIVGDRQKKKKAAKRPTTVTIIMKNYCTIMPKNKERKQLKFQGRSKDFKILHSASDTEIHNLINRAFNVSSFTVFESDSSGHNLLKCPIQHVNGEFAVSRRGCLYLCEFFEVMELFDRFDALLCMYIKKGPRECKIVLKSYC